MHLSRICLGLLTLVALTLAGCSTVPLGEAGSAYPSEAQTSAPAEAARSGADSPYTLQAPKRRSGPVFPTGPLTQIATETPKSQVLVTPLAAPADLWERLRRGFAMPDLDTPLVRDREEWYAARPDYLERMTERGSKYMFHIVEELERRNLPLELALLPFIESAFNPQAVSTAKAAGMWQFMPATGRHFDLKQNMFRDDRRDVLASTRAALDYLERLHKMFGNWHLALAAYNWGEGSVGRAIKRNEKAGLGTSYTELTMPNETRYYVPKFQAIKNLVLYPERHNVKLPDIGNHPFFETVTLPRDMDVGLIAKLADVSEKDFRQLNPSANKPVILAAGTPTVLLPWDNAALFEQRVKSHNGPWASWTAWPVPNNMTVAKAADLHGLPETQLREINKIPPRMLVKAGSTLLVPRHGRNAQDVPEHVADNGQILLAQEVKLRTLRVKARAGESVQQLAARHRVNANDVAVWNNLSLKSVLKAGQSLVLQVPSTSRKVVRAAPRSTTPPSGKKAHVKPVGKPRKK
jgi:membrane-bound lytic murein transglycosylase D